MILCNNALESGSYCCLNLWSSESSSSACFLPKPCHIRQLTTHTYTHWSFYGVGLFAQRLVLSMFPRFHSSWTLLQVVTPFVHLVFVAFKAWTQFLSSFLQSLLGFFLCDHFQFFVFSLQVSQTVHPEANLWEVRSCPFSVSETVLPLLPLYEASIPSPRHWDTNHHWQEHRTWNPHLVNQPGWISSLLPGLCIWFLLFRKFVLQDLSWPSSLDPSGSAWPPSGIATSGTGSGRCTPGPLEPPIWCWTTTSGSSVDPGAGPSFRSRSSMSSASLFFPLASSWVGRYLFLLPCASSGCPASTSAGLSKGAPAASSAATFGASGGGLPSSAGCSLAFLLLFFFFHSPFPLFSLALFTLALPSADSISIRSRHSSSCVLWPPCSN